MKKSLTRLAALGLITIAISSFASESNPYSWSGPYAGLNLGYGWGNSFTIFNDTPLSINLDQRGGLFGGQVGFDWQIKQSYVVGLEYTTDISGIAGGNNGIGGTTERITWIGDLLPRLGYLPIPNFLLYGTGGLAFGNLSGSMTSPSSNNSTAAPNSINITSPGWAVGAGAEWIFVPHWSFSAEYLYNQFENGTGTDNIANENFTIKTYYQTTELKLNWRMSM